MGHDKIGRGGIGDWGAGYASDMASGVLEVPGWCCQDLPVCELNQVEPTFTAKTISRAGLWAGSDGQGRCVQRGINCFQSCLAQELFL